MTRRDPFVPLGGWAVTTLAAAFALAAILWWAA